MNKFTKLEDEIISILTEDHLPPAMRGYNAREIYDHSKLAADEKEVRKALNAMVKRGEIVRDKDKLYSVADQKAPDVVDEISETKKEEPVLDVMDRHVKAITLLAGSGVFVQAYVDAITRLANDPEFRKFAVAYGKAGNAPG